MEKRVLVLVVCLLALLQVVVATQHLCEDIDGDTYVVSISTGCSSPLGIDCNDNNPNVNPGVSESSTNCGNGIDDDCDGYSDDNDPGCTGCEDKDFDGYKVVVTSGASCGTLDCDDTNAFLNSGATEICGDGIDNDCDNNVDEECTQSQGTGPDTGVCSVVDKYWVDCDADTITTANEGDSVFLVVETEDCDSNADVDYEINEHNDNEAPYQVATSGIDYVNADGDTTSFAGSWLASWIDDATTDPDPEYYFEYTLIEPSGSTFQGSSSTVDPLVVTQCPASNPNCGDECQLSGGYLVLNPPEQEDSFATTFPVEDCVSSWDCSQVAWSECDPSSGIEYRDTSLCLFTGTGDAECQTASLAALADERVCSGSLRPPTGSAREKGLGARCGNLRCEVGEEESCPGDCADRGFPWGWVIFIGVLVVLLGVGVFFYLKLHKSTASLAGKPSNGVKGGISAGVSPFSKVSDLTAVVGYIKLAKQKGLQDQNIKEMLLKSGWTTNQIEYAFRNLNHSGNGSQQKSI